MRCGIIILGSLLWDSKTTGRDEWRASRIDVSARVQVQMPIYYGRKSSTRGSTYTMTFRDNKSAGRAWVVPCIARIKTIENLIGEANALWRAEAKKVNLTTIGSDWGCVGALFACGAAHEKLSADWSTHFQRVQAQCVSVVKPDGLLRIVWPNTLDRKPADFDIILAAATKPEPITPSAPSIADAWVDQCGNEDYFFNNILQGIRTPDDGDIWRRIKEKSPCWLENKKREYQAAIEILQSEIAPCS